MHVCALTFAAFSPTLFRPHSLDYPTWFFPQHFSFAARSLLSGLLHPDASSRLSVRQVIEPCVVI